MATLGLNSKQYTPSIDLKKFKYFGRIIYKKMQDYLKNALTIFNSNSFAIVKVGENIKLSFERRLAYQRHTFCFVIL